MQPEGKCEAEKEYIRNNMGTSERKEFNTKHNTNITDYVNMIINLCVCIYNIYNYFIQPQIRKSWDSMENANKKRK